MVVQVRWSSMVTPYEMGSSVGLCAFKLRGTQAKAWSHMPLIPWKVLLRSASLVRFFSNTDLYLLHRLLFSVIIFLTNDESVSLDFFGGFLLLLYL